MGYNIPVPQIITAVIQYRSFFFYRIRFSSPVAAARGWRLQVTTVAMPGNSPPMNRVARLEKTAGNCPTPFSPAPPHTPPPPPTPPPHPRTGHHGGDNRSPSFARQLLRRAALNFGAFVTASSSAGGDTPPSSRGRHEVISTRHSSALSDRHTHHFYGVLYTRCLESL